MLKEVNILPFLLLLVDEPFGNSHRQEHVLEMQVQTGGFPHVLPTQFITEDYPSFDDTW